MVLRVVFADDNFLVRKGVAALLAELDHVELVGCEPLLDSYVGSGGRASGPQADQVP